MSSTKARALLGLLLAAAAAPALAAADAAETIVVTADRATALDLARTQAARVPGGVSTIDAASFEDKLAVSLRDTLAFAPGVYAQPRYGEEVRLSIRGSGIGRGFHLRGIALLVDGAPINLADGSGDFQEIDATAIQRLDVWRGANALRFGASSLGGAVNVTTPTGLSAPGGAVRVEGGSFGTLRASAAAGFSNGPGDAWIGLSYLRDDGFRQQSGQDKLRLNANVGLRLTDRLATRFYAAANRIDQGVPGTLTLVQALATPRIAPPVNLANAYARDIDSLRLQNRTTLDLDSVQVEAGAFVNAKQLFHPIFQVINQKSLDRGAYLRATATAQVAGLKVEAVAGGTLRSGSIDAKQYLNVGGQRGALTASALQRATTNDAYGELRVYPVDSLALVAGAQLTGGSRRVDNRLVPANSARTTYGGQLSPKVGAVWTPVANVQLFANVSRSAELPTFAELVQGAVPGFVPLAPQRGWTVEVGTRGQAGPVSWDLAAYRADLKGELLAFTINPTVPASTFNAGSTRHQGVEAGLDVQLAPWAVLRQAYLLNDFTFEADPQYGFNRLPVVPRHLYRAELRLGGEALHVSPSVEWVPQGPWADYRNTVRTPGYALLSLSAAAKLSGRLTAFLDARNLTDKRAVGDLSAVILATPGSAIYYPVEGRGVFVGLRGTF